MNCKHCGTEFNDSVNFCPNCGESVETLEKKLGMCFYKFVTYFQMPFGALIAAVTGVMFLPGMLNKLIDSLHNSQYGSYIAGRLYFLNDSSVKHALIFYAVTLFAISLYCVYISFLLVKFRKNAPKHIYINLISEKIVVYIFMAVLLILQKDIVDINVELMMELVPRVVTDVMSVVLWLLIYSRYFNKRKHLFTN